MAVSPSAAGRRYGPLIVLAVVELALVLIAPSTPPKTTGPLASGTAAGLGQTTLQTTDGGGAGTGTGSGQAVGTGGDGLSGTGTGGGTGTNSAVTSDGSAGGGGSSSTGSGGTAPGTGGGGLNKWGYASSDMSHCAKDGTQLMPVSYAPQCRPVWHGGDNGGATMTGVSDKEIRFVYYRSAGNAQVNAVLAQKDLATTDDQFCQALDAFVKEVNKRFELYGRKLVSMDGAGPHAGSKVSSNCHYPYYQSTCSLTPPDPPCYQAEASVIAAMKPAFVLAPVATQTQLLQRLPQLHVITFGGSAGGENIPESYFDSLQPYLWNVLPNGTQVVRNLAEYYCKKLATKPVQFAGPDVLTWDGIGKPAPTRKVAMIYPQNSGDPVFKESAELFKNLVTQCGSKDTLLISYSSDINTAQQQSSNTIAQLKQHHITTVTSIGDPIAPVFFSETADHNNYHPEILISGTAYSDYDVLGQLYDPNVWRYAFGPSSLGNSVPFTQSDAMKAWRDVGFSGQPAAATNAMWIYLSLLGNVVQNAGPHLDLAHIRAAMTNAPAQGGSATLPGSDFRNPYPWTGWKDFREVYYCPTQKSPINGQLGAYLPVDGGKRYRLGSWTATTDGLFPGGPCAG